MRSDFWLCNTSCHLLIPWLTLVRTRVGTEEQSWWRHYPGIHRASLKGCNVLWDCRLSRLYLPPPWRPPSVAILFSWKYCVESRLSTWQKSTEACSKGSFLWVHLLTTGAAPHLNLMDPTYAVIAMPTSCQLWCSEAFVLQRDATVSCWSVSVYNKSPPQRSHQSKCFSSSPRSFDYCKAWIH